MLPDVKVFANSENDLNCSLVNRMNRNLYSVIYTVHWSKRPSLHSLRFQIFTMGNQLFSSPPPNLLEQNYDHKDIKLWRVNKEIQPRSSGGPLNFGDPDDRSLSEEEVKVIIPRRMYQTCKETMCLRENEVYNKCWEVEGAMALARCDQAPVNKCMKDMFSSSQFRLAIAREYMDERSHYRQTGQRTPRYLRTNWVSRLPGDFGMDANGDYKPRKPLGWSQAYPGGEPSWAGTGPTGVDSARASRSESQQTNPAETEGQSTRTQL